jgi:hypothetical protein
MLALVSAGSKLLPIAERRLKDNFFAHSIVFEIVTVEIAMREIPFQIRNQILQYLDTIIHSTQSTVAGITKNPAKRSRLMVVVGMPAVRFGFGTSTHCTSVSLGSEHSIPLFFRETVTVKSFVGSFTCHTADIAVRSHTDVLWASIMPTSTI